MHVLEVVRIKKGSVGLNIRATPSLAISLQHLSVNPDNTFLQPG